MASSWLETRLEQQAGLIRQKGSEQERHSIGPLWLLLQSGLQGARTGLETSQEAARALRIGSWRLQ